MSGVITNCPKETAKRRVQDECSAWRRKERCKKSLTKTMTKEGDDKNGNKHRRIKPNNNRIA
jgi:hypothetical protein